MKRLCLILGDQLSESIAALQGLDKAQDVVLMVEVMAEATYVRHHKKKIALLLSAMRHFARNLKENGWKIDYVDLDDPSNTGAFRGEVGRAIQRHRPDEIVTTFPGEYRVLKDMLAWEDAFSIPVDIRADTRFLCAPAEFARWAEGRKQLRMEYFYRDMRRRYGLMMDGEDPAGGQWNYDSENRKTPEGDLAVPPPFMVAPDEITQKAMELVEKRFPDHFGDLTPFHYAVTHADAQHALDHFIRYRLPRFGDYQDAMVQGQPWMFHSHLSFYINCGLLDPLAVVRAAEKAYRTGHAPLNAVEGFIRQIIGWREYVRGIYWLKMPDYAAENHLGATRRLPWLYWSGETQMNCLRQCVTETRQNAYAHHIQRLMVLGNFALLAGIDPKDVNEWFLVVYADAYEWVEMPNVTGMILFADGGLLASKPYAAGGAYINRMSDYCKGCRYKVSSKNGPDACPFNYLYWDFMIRNQDTLSRNPRLAHSYRTLSKMTAEKVRTIKDDAARFFKRLDGGDTV